MTEGTIIKGAKDDTRALKSVTSMDYLLIAYDNISEKYESKPSLLGEVGKIYSGDPQGDWASTGANGGALRSNSGCESHFRAFQKVVTCGKCLAVVKCLKRIRNQAKA